MCRFVSYKTLLYAPSVARRVLPQRVFFYYGIARDSLRSVPMTGCSAAEFDIEGTIRAFGKVIGIQTQFISKWYEDPVSQCGHGPPATSSWCSIL
eukprot:sb/3479260/